MPPASPIPRIIPVILSGGAGTRLWPLSREAAPKPFMPLPDGETLLGKTARRAIDLPNVSQLITVTNRDLYFHTKDVYLSAQIAPADGNTYLLEPFGRNTAPAVALGALFAQARGWDDAVLLVLPADHLIRDSQAFAAAIAPATILAAFARHAPGVLDTTRPIVNALTRTASGMLEIDAAQFAAVPDISIDYAVMEAAAAAGEVAVVRGSFDWSDVGSWQAVAALTETDDDGNGGHGERVAIATRGTYVHSGARIVATVGVENLVIVDTPDAVLVAHRDHLQRVKDVVGELKARGHEAYKLHRTVARPWGAYT